MAIDPGVAEGVSLFEGAFEDMADAGAGAEGGLAHGGGHAADFFEEVAEPGDESAGAGAAVLLEGVDEFGEARGGGGGEAEGAGESACDVAALFFALFDGFEEGGFGLDLTAEEGEVGAAEAFEFASQDIAQLQMQIQELVENLHEAIGGGFAECPGMC